MDTSPDSTHQLSSHICFWRGHFKGSAQKAHQEGSELLRCISQDYARIFFSPPSDPRKILHFWGTAGPIHVVSRMYEEKLCAAVHLPEQ